MTHTTIIRFQRQRGFTLTEVLFAASISMTIVALTMGIYIGVFKSWLGLEQRMDADREVNIALSRMVYGMGDRRGIRSASTVNVVTNTPSGGWTLTYGVALEVPQTNTIIYSPASKTLRFNPGSLMLGTNISLATLNLQGSSMIVTLRVDRVKGTLSTRREVGTRISWRN